MHSLKTLLLSDKNIKDIEFFLAVALEFLLPGKSKERSIKPSAAAHQFQRNAYRLGKPALAGELQRFHFQLLTDFVLSLGQ